MYTKKKKIVITVAVIVILVITVVYFSIGGILVNAKRLGEISGYYTGINLREDGTEIRKDDEDSDVFI